MQTAAANPEYDESPTRPLALITGASSGIGAAFARAYARRGVDVALVARRVDRLNRLADEIARTNGVKAIVLPADLSASDAPQTIFREIKARGRTVDILVNNAGFGVPQTFGRVPWERHREFLMVSVAGPCALTHEVLPEMVARRRGAIINVSSITAMSPGAAGHTLYPAAKSFLLKFSQSLDAELREHGIRVTAVCPGFTRTEFHEANGTAALMERAPRRFWTSAEAVVEAAIAGNARGKTVVIPGWHNKLAVALMKYLPDGIVIPIIRAGAARYRVED